MNEIRRIELPQGTIHYRDIGQGPPVVFVHGLVVNGSVFGEVPERLTGFRCLVPDWPLGSHPEPMHPDADLSSRGLAALIAGFIERLGLEDVTLVGNDSGGALCQLVVAHHPERIARLVLTTCDAFEYFPPPDFQYLLRVARIPAVLRWISRLMRWFPLLQRLPIAYGALTARSLPQSLLDAWITPSANEAIRRDTAKFLRSIDSRDLFAAYERLRDFQKPVLLAWTPEDRNFPVTLAHRLQKVFPFAQLKLISNARVFVSLDQPEQVAELIATFSRPATLSRAR
jgi:pimeloyl-ACP methyl ester carboxylesterase